MLCCVMLYCGVLYCGLVWCVALCCAVFVRVCTVLWCAVLRCLPLSVVGKATETTKGPGEKNKTYQRTHSCISLWEVFTVPSEAALEPVTTGERTFLEFNIETSSVFPEDIQRDKTYNIHLMHHDTTEGSPKNRERAKT